MAGVCCQQHRHGDVFTQQPCGEDGGRFGFDAENAATSGCRLIHWSWPSHRRRMPSASSKASIQAFIGLQVVHRACPVMHRASPDHGCGGGVTAVRARCGSPTPEWLPLRRLRCPASPAGRLWCSDDQIPGRPMLSWVWRANGSRWRGDTTAARLCRVGPGFPRVCRTP